jgi:predicted glycosyltransferase
MYWHNGRSLGHTAETAKVAHALTSGAPSLQLAGLTGAYRGLDLLPAELDVVKLPAFSNYDKTAGWALAGRQGFEGEALFRARSELCSVFLRHFAPDLLIVNHLPRGAEGELEDALKEKRTGARILSLRGVLFGREKTAREYFGPTMQKWIESHFDLIVVHTDRQIFDLEAAYDIPTSISKRLRYVGYLASPIDLSVTKARQQLNVAPDERLVVASMGGGQGALEIWRSVISALCSNKDLFDSALIVTGPYFESDQRELLNAITAQFKWLSVASYEPMLPLWMKAADLFIGAGGANMLGEIVANRCNSVVIPRQVREPEQQIHTGLLEARGVIRAISLQEALAGELSSKVREALQEPLQHTEHFLLDGAKRYLDIISDVTGVKV